MLKTRILFRVLKKQAKMRQELGAEQSRKRAIRWCLDSLGNGK